MTKIIVGIVLTLLVVTNTGRRVVKMEWNHLQSVSSVVYNGVTR